MNRAEPIATRAGETIAGPLSASEVRRAPSHLLPLAAGFLIILLIGGISLFLVREGREENARVTHTLQVLAALAELDQAITEANSTQRGWILTRSDIFRDRFNNAYRAVPPALAEAQTLVADNPEQTRRADRLATQVADRLAEIDRVNLLVLRGDLASAIGRTLEARAQTDDIRQTLGALQAAEETLLATRQRAAERTSAFLVFTNLAGLVAIILIAASTLRALRREANQLRLANAAVEELNRELEGRVAARTADLEEANAEIQRFAYIVSHDLRSPLVNVMGFTAELEESAAAAARLVGRTEAAVPGLIAREDRELLVEDFPESLRFIRSSTARMDGLIRAILQLSREGRRTLSPERVELGMLMEELAASLQQQTETADAAIEIGTLPAIECDRVALEQIFGNLLDNAIKYLRPGIPGEIRVSAEETGPFVRVTVADNGRGIAAEDQERVFDLFRRAGAQDRPGEGLGLAHVRALTRRLGGSIRLESTPGMGSRFIVALPRHMRGTDMQAGVLA
jgi:signal transduction histidine kinase